MSTRQHPNFHASPTEITKRTAITYFANLVLVGLLASWHFVPVNYWNGLSPTVTTKLCTPSLINRSWSRPSDSEKTRGPLPSIRSASCRTCESCSAANRVRSLAVGSSCICIPKTLAQNSTPRSGSQCALVSWNPSSWTASLRSRSIGFPPLPKVLKKARKTCSGVSNCSGQQDRMVTFCSLNGLSRRSSAMSASCKSPSRGDRLRKLNSNILCALARSVVADVSRASDSAACFSTVSAFWRAAVAIVNALDAVPSAFLDAEMAVLEASSAARALGSTVPTCIMAVLASRRASLALSAASLANSPKSPVSLPLVAASSVSSPDCRNSIPNSPMTPTVTSVPAPIAMISARILHHSNGTRPVMYIHSNSPNRMNSFRYSRIRPTATAAVQMYNQILKYSDWRSRSVTRLASRSISDGEIDVAIKDYQGAYQKAMESQRRFHEAEWRCLMIIAITLAFGWIPFFVWRMYKQR